MPQTDLYQTDLYRTDLYRTDLYQIDAFTSRVFGGNPAAVCPLNGWLPEDVMQAIALENNLSETAFFVPRPPASGGAEGGGAFDIRWFTPAAEIDLAGHPTLATAWVIFTHLAPDLDTAVFHTRLGDTLTVRRDGPRLAMDFPARPPAETADAAAIAAALGGAPVEVLAARDGLAVYETAGEVAALSPNLPAIARLPYLGVIATAPGPAAAGAGGSGQPGEADGCDFVSRFFAPAAGVPEDPVTGSAHCTLIPYWAQRLGKTALFARQISARGGEIWAQHRGGRVTIAGECAEFMRGEILLPGTLPPGPEPS